jgi:NAD(P)-dependent dehydrogenase (short-subunit alcohol dehydrogenase family)
VKVLELFELSGKVGIVTGAAQNLGRQSALALAEAGADVAICDLLETQGEQTCSDIKSLGRRCLFGKVDVTRPEEIADFVRWTLDSLGKIDILVNNVGIPCTGRRLEDEDEESWGRVIETNLTSVFSFSKVVAKHMIERGEGGVILNMGSIAGMIINNITPRHNVPYCVSKAGVLHLTRGMASDWAQYGIRVNAIAPGHMMTDQIGYMDQYPEIGERVLANTPLKRLGQVDELKGTLIYLASNASSFMTGSVIVIDGGITIW